MQTNMDLLTVPEFDKDSCIVFSAQKYVRAAESGTEALRGQSTYQCVGRGIVHCTYRVAVPTQAGFVEASGGTPLREAALGGIGNRLAAYL
jgi:hypothetical protein